MGSWSELDLKNPNTPMFFEGPEKKFELLLAPGHPSLRSLEKAFWGRVVARARAEILSTVSNDNCDAYLLSESTLVVYDHRVIMITCGRTTLVESIFALLNRIPADWVASLIYERKNENFPHLQRTSFEEDVAAIQKAVSGTALVFGDKNKDHISLFHLDRDFKPDPNDATLELLMYKIDPHARALFAPRAASSVEIQTRTGLSTLCPEFIFDDHLFEPMGYSCNGILGPHYATLHVTPQRVGSYTSFETNYGMRASEVGSTVTRLLDFFRPARSDVLLFQSRMGTDFLDDDFRVESNDTCQLGCGYTVQYVHIERELAGRRSTPR